DALAVEPHRHLGPDARHVHQRDDAGRDLLRRPVDVADVAGLQIFGDLPGEVGAHAGDLVQPILPGQRLHVFAERLEVLGGPPVGADAEGVLLLQLEHVGHEVEEPRHLEVLHGPGSTSGTRESWASHTAATASLGARQSPRGESEPPEPTLGALGRQLRLNWLSSKKRSRKIASTRLITPIGYRSCQADQARNATLAGA